MQTEDQVNGTTEEVTTESIAAAIETAANQAEIEGEFDAKTDTDENLDLDANHTGSELFAVIDALTLDEESATYLANTKKFYAGASEQGKKDIEKSLAIRFLKN